MEAAKAAHIPRNPNVHMIRALNYFAHTSALLRNIHQVIIERLQAEITVRRKRHRVLRNNNSNKLTPSFVCERTLEGTVFRNVHARVLAQLPQMPFRPSSGMICVVPKNVTTRTANSWLKAPQEEVVCKRLEWCEL
eukprot:5348752-Pleurochrysis_carterae.AAC.9